MAVDHQDSPGWLCLSSLVFFIRLMGSKAQDVDLFVRIVILGPHLDLCVSPEVWGGGEKRDSRL